MKMQALFEKVSQVFNVAISDDITYSFALGKVGEDGAGRPVYVGDCTIHSAKRDSTSRMKCAIVMRPTGTLYAAHYGENGNLDDTNVRTAAGLAIKSKRKAYGVGHPDQLENWVTYRENEAEVDGYDASID